MPGIFFFFLFLATCYLLYRRRNVRLRLRFSLPYFLCNTKVNTKREQNGNLKQGVRKAGILPALSMAIIMYILWDI